jgi:hypothetical protein
MALRNVKWIAGLLALIGCSSVWAAMEPVSLADQIRERRDSSTLMDVASGASLMLDRGSLLTGWFDLGHRNSWINVARLAESPDSAGALHLSAGHVASVTLIASGTIQISSWVSFSEGSIAGVVLSPISGIDISLSSTPITLLLDSSAVVPLPAAGWLFLSVLGPFLIGVKRRRS